MLSASANLPIANFDLRTQFTVAPYQEPRNRFRRGGLSSAKAKRHLIILIRDSLLAPSDDPAAAEGQAPAEEGIFENPAPTEDPCRKSCSLTF